MEKLCPSIFDLISTLYARSFFFLVFVPSSKKQLLTMKTADHRGGSKISGKGVYMFKGVGVHFAGFISFFLNIT